MAWHRSTMYAAQRDVCCAARRVLSVMLQLAAVGAQVAGHGPARARVSSPVEWFSGAAGGSAASFPELSVSHTYLAAACVLRAQMLLMLLLRWGRSVACMHLRHPPPPPAAFNCLQPGSLWLSPLSRFPGAPHHAATCGSAPRRCARQLWWAWVGDTVRSQYHMYHALHSWCVHSQAQAARLLSSFLSPSS